MGRVGVASGRRGPAVPVKAQPQEKDRKLSPISAALKKVRENLPDLDELVTDMTVDHESKLTLLEQVQADVEQGRSGHQVVWGKGYYNALRKKYSTQKPMQKALGKALAASPQPKAKQAAAGAPASTSTTDKEPEIDPELFQAMYHDHD